jgi:hypothetical protein
VPTSNSGGFAIIDLIKLPTLFLAGMSALTTLADALAAWCKTSVELRLENLVAATTPPAAMANAGRAGFRGLDEKHLGQLGRS